MLSFLDYSGSFFYVKHKLSLSLYVYVCVLLYLSLSVSLCNTSYYTVQNMALSLFGYNTSILQVGTSQCNNYSFFAALSVLGE